MQSTLNALDKSTYHMYKLLWAMKICIFINKE